MSTILSDEQIQKLYGELFEEQPEVIFEEPPEEQVYSVEDDPDLTFEEHIVIPRQVSIGDKFKQQLSNLITQKAQEKGVSKQEQLEKEKQDNIAMLKEYDKILEQELLKLQEEEAEERKIMRLQNIEKIEQMIDEEEELRSQINVIKRELSEIGQIGKPEHSMRETIKIPKINREMPMEYYLEKRPLSSYPSKVLNELALIAINENSHAKPFGSYTYRFQQYPGDIDGMEEIGECCSKGEAARKYVQAIKRIVKNIVEKRSHYYSEVKAGINPLFDFSIGEMKNGRYTPKKGLLKLIDEYYDKKFITREEYLILMNTIGHSSKPKVFDSDVYDIVEYIFRKHRVLRWTSDEIIQGYKKIEDGSIISLYDAIQMNTMTKIDEVALIDGTFIEITNNWHLAWMDKKGNYEIFNEKRGVPEDLPKEIEKLYFSNMFYSPFKTIKRIYSYSRYKLFNTKDSKWKKYIGLVGPLLQSDVSLAYQIKSELDTLVLVLGLYKRPSPATINNQLDNTKQRIASVLSLKEETLKRINNFINIAIESTINELKIMSINEVINILKRMINYKTIIYLKKVHMNPPPKDLLPNPMNYGYIVREPLDDPKDPVKLQIEVIKLQKSGGCETCGGVLLGGECLTCRDNPYIQLANMIKNMY